MKTASKTEEIDFIEILDEIHEKKAKIIEKLISFGSQKFEKILKKIFKMSLFKIRSGKKVISQKESTQFSHSFSK